MKSGRGVFLSAQDQFRCRQVQEFMCGKVSRSETARLLQLSERTVSRLAGQIHRKGVRALAHANRGRPPHNKTAVALKRRVIELVQSRYYDFNLTHCLEMLQEREKIVVGYGVFRRWCHEHQLVKRKRRRRARARYLRTRMPSSGYLLQLDGSPDYYNGRQVWHLIAAIDDATSEVPHAEFFSQEGSQECMDVMRKIIAKKGIPRAVYVDKAGWSGGQKRAEFSQFKRACEELDIQVLFADSPEAKGRIERSFGTFHDRLIPELRLNRITQMQEANRYLSEQFLPKYWNQRNTVAPRSPESAYSPIHASLDLGQIFCRKYERKLGGDSTFSWQGHIYAVKSRLAYSLKRKTIEVRYQGPGKIEAYFQNERLEIRCVKRPTPMSESGSVREYEQHLSNLDRVLWGKLPKRTDTGRMRKLIAERKKQARRDSNETKSLKSYRDKIVGN